MWLPDVMTSTPWANRLSPISRVIPLPPAEFSPLTMTKSMAWQRHQRRQPDAHEIAAGASDDVADKEQFHARRVDSMGTARPRAAAIGQLRQRDAQLAVGQRGADAAALEGAAHAHRTGKASGAPLDQVIAAGPGSRPGHPFLAGNQHDDPLMQHAQRRGGDPRHIQQDFDGFVGFDDVERRHAVAGGRAPAAGSLRPAPGAGAGRPRSGRPAPPSAAQKATPS